MKWLMALNLLVWSACAGKYIASEPPPVEIQHIVVDGSLDGASVAPFLRALGEARSVGVALIEFRKASGGRIDAAEAMREAMRVSGVKTVCVVTGYAASAALWLYSACSQRLMLPDAMLGPHAPHWDSAIPESQQAQYEQERIERWAQMAVDITAGSQVSAKTYIEKTAAAEWWISAEWAALNGLARLIRSDELSEVIALELK